MSSRILDPPSPSPGPDRAGEWLREGGELGELIRAADWSPSPLGPRDAWPAPLRTSLGLVLASRFPMALLWGRELLLLYNDAYRAVAGAKHPAALGRPIREVWPEAWRVNASVLAAVMARGETFYLEDAPFPMDRHGARQEAWFTICFSPVRLDDGAVAGILATMQETTAQLAERKRLVRERERALETFEHGDACVVLDRDFRIVLVNAEQERLSATPRSASVGRIVWDVWPHIADPGRQFWPKLNRAMRQRTPVQFEEYDPVRRRWYDLRVYPSVEGGIAVFSQDVTGRREAAAALRDREQRLRGIFDEAAVGIAEIDASDRFVAVNARFAQMLGYAPRELAGKTLQDVTAPEDLEATSTLHARGRAGVLPMFDYEKRYLRPDGTRLWVHVNVSIVRDEEGRFLRSIATAEDITARKRAQEALRASEERLRRMIEVTPIGVVRCDDSGRILDANDGYLRTVGYARGDLEAGRVRWDAITPAEYLPRDIRAIAEARALGVSTVYEKEHLRPDGRRVPVLVALAAIDGRSRELTAFVVDISERRSAEDALRGSEERLREANDQLREADRRKDEFLGMLSHELRNPLAPVRNALYILDRAPPGGEQARRAQEVASRQIAHMTRLVDDLLDVTRIARGKIELRLGEVDLAALARRAAEDQRGLMQDRHLSLAVEVPRHPVRVSGDETRLAQVLGNLLHNAAKFTPPGGHVTLTLAAEGDQAVFHVRDSGSGLEPGMLRTIFEPFTQGKQTLARSEGGLGLGLALVKGLVALHGGDASAWSDGPGLGTDFTVTLPLAPARPPASPAERRQAPEAGAPRRHRVLVIDDNRDAADSLGQLVAMLGHEAEVAYDAFEGLEKASMDRPDVVLCDIGLPGMDGYEFARRLRAGSAAREGLRLVAVSGYAQPEDVSRAIEAGFDAHVAKPPDPERIATLLE